MIQDLDKTIERLLYERGRLSRSDIDVSFEQPNSDWSARISRPTLNVWCFDIQENVKLRAMEPRMDRGMSLARTTFRPIRLDVVYLVTAWARKVEDEHQLLWRALGAMAQTPELTPELCEGSLKEQPFVVPLLVANMPERMPNMSDLWSVLNNQMRLGFTAIVTLSLDRAITFETPLVLEAEITAGQALFPESRTLDVRDKPIIHRAPARPSPDGEDSAPQEGRRRRK